MGRPEYKGYLDDLVRSFYTMNVKYIIVGDGYMSTESYTYNSKRYNKTITIPAGFYSDGATAVPDIQSDGPWVHDYICRFGVWNDGSNITNWQASMVLRDILWSEGYYFQAVTGFIGTWLLGGGAARKNGWV